MNTHNRLRVALAFLSGRFTWESMNEADRRALCPRGYISENDLKCHAEDVVFEYLTKKESKP